ncbi:MAG: hypothetical protein ACE5D2_06125 [Fidelibacterota bacterium]
MTDHKFTRMLVGWYGFLQAIHLIVLLIARFKYVKTGAVGFPAPGPPGGWSPQTNYFLLGLGYLDFCTAIIALLFIYRFFTKKHRYRTLGLVVLSSSTVSAIIFGLGTFPSGAWNYHPITYFAMLVLYLPVIILFFVFIKNKVPDRIK